jgi:hypothetical protein
MGLVGCASFGLSVDQHLSCTQGPSNWRGRTSIRPAQQERREEKLRAAEPQTSWWPPVLRRRGVPVRSGGSALAAALIVVAGPAVWVYERS